jgi:NADH dehydrogenase [ubiquinone] 1 alpha subcomplex assembly factor 5
MGSMFGSDTLKELRTSIQLAETERKGGIGAHVSPFTTTKDVGDLLSRTNYNLITVDNEKLTVMYPSMFELMDDLALMGESQALLNPSPLSRDTLIAASAIYQDLYGDGNALHVSEPKGGVPATFNVIYFIGWKYSKDQPKPLEPGSATISLKDLHESLK